MERLRIKRWKCKVDSSVMNSGGKNVLSRRLEGYSVMFRRYLGEL